MSDVERVHVQVDPLVHEAPMPIAGAVDAAPAEAKPSGIGAIGAAIASVFKHEHDPVEPAAALFVPAVAEPANTMTGSQDEQLPSADSSDVMHESEAPAVWVQPPPFDPLKMQAAADTSSAVSPFPTNPLLPAAEPMLPTVSTVGGTTGGPVVVTRTDSPAIVAEPIPAPEVAAEPPTPPIEEPATQLPPPLREDSKTKIEAILASITPPAPSSGFKPSAGELEANAANALSKPGAPSLSKPAAKLAVKLQPLHSHAVANFGALTFVLAIGAHVAARLIAGHDPHSVGALALNTLDTYWAIPLLLGGGGALLGKSPLDVGQKPVVTPPDATK